MCDRPAGATDAADITRRAQEVNVFRDMPRILQCLASIPMVFWTVITTAARKPGEAADRNSPHDPGQYFADDPWVD